MANETLITDLVAREAIEQLVELDGKMDATLTKFKDCARELARGLKVPVEVNGDVDKLRQLYDVTMKDLAHATAEYTQQVQAQQRVVANTTNTISRQLAEQEKLNKVQREAFVQEQGALDIADRILGTREQNIRQLASYKKQLEQVKAERKAGMITDEEALSREMELKAAMQETQKVLKNETKMNQAASGSYQQLSLQLERLKQAQKQLNEEEKAGEEGQALEKEIQNLDAHLKDLAADMGEFQRNVGNYAVANGSLKSELRETTAQLAQMLADGVDPTSEEFLKLAERAGTLKDAMNDAKATINDYANDTKGLTNTLSVVQTGMSAWQAYVGVLNAFGVESSDAQKSMQKMMGIMTTLNALQKISTELTTNGTGAYRAYHAILRIIGVEQAGVKTATEGTTAALGAQTTATVGATAAASALRVALAALGIGAVIALLGALYSAYSEWTEAAEEAEEQQKALAKEMDSASSTYGENRASLTRLTDSWKSLKTEQEKNQFIKDNKKAFDDLGVSVNNIDDANNLLVKNTASFIKSMELRAKATAYGALAAQEYAKAIKALETGEGVELTTTEKISNWFDGLIKSDAYNAGVERRQRQAQYNRSNIDGNRYTAEQARLNQEAADVLAKAGIRAAGSSASSANKAGSRSGGNKNTAKDITEQIAAMIADSDALLNEWQSRMGSIAVEMAKTITSGSKEAFFDQVKTVRDSYNTIEASIQESSLKAQKEENEKFDKMIAAAKKAGKDTTELEVAKVNALSAISAKYNEEVIANDKARNETIEKMRKDYIALATKEIQDFYAGEQAMADVSLTQELTSIKRRYAQGLITKEQYEEESASITEQYSEETIERQINSLKKQLSVANLTTEERKKLEQELTKAQTDLASKRADAEIDQIERVKKADEKAMEERKKKTEAWVQLSAQALGNFADFASTMFDNRIAEIEQELEAEQQQHDVRIQHIDDLAEHGAITEEEAEIRKRDALAETQRKQEALQKRKNELAYKQAIIDKANSVSQIAISTAQAVMQTYAQFGNTPWGIALAAAVGVMGAVQAATALAQPIKAYKEGTKGKAHPGGLAIVGDGDKPEVVMFGGRAWITPDSPTLVDLPKGAQVLPDADALTLRRMGSTLVGNVPRNGHGSGPIIINDYDALESKMANNTKVLARGFNQLGADIKRELRRQSFRDYIKRRT